MLKLKLQYFGHLMQRVDSLEKTLMLGGFVLGTGLPGLGTEHLPGALCSGTGSPALGLKLGKEYVKAVYCPPAYLTSMQSTS